MERDGMGPGVIPPPPPGFYPVPSSAIPPPPEGFEPVDASLPRFIQEFGTKQDDGNYLVKRGEVTQLFTPEGNPVEDVKAKLDHSEATGLEKVLTTVNSGAQGLVPQVAGLKAALEVDDPEGAKERYRLARDRAKQATDAASEKAGLGYQVAGAVLSGGLAAPESIAGRVALAGGLGALNAATSSGGDVTRLDEGDNAAQLLKETAMGAGTGLLAGGVGEAVGAGLNKATGFLRNSASEAIASQAAKDVGAVEKEIASLKGKLGSETQQGSRMLENLQRGISGTPPIYGGGAGAVGPEMQAKAIVALESAEGRKLAEKVLERNLEALPGKTASIQALEAELAAKTAGAAKEVEARTRAYFAAPIFQSEVLPRLKQMAPRFGLAAVGAATGSAYDFVTGDTHGSGGFTGAVLGAPGMLMMLKNVAKSPRVRTTIAAKMAPLIQAASSALGAGLVPSLNVLGGSVLHEQALGDPDLAAEKLTARGGLKSVLGDSPPDAAALVGASAPAGPLDRAIAQTVGVATLAGALSEHDEEIDRHVEKILKGAREPHHAAAAALASQDFGSKRMRQEAEDAHDKRVTEAAQLAADPSALVTRVTNNTGGLSEVAPNVAGALTRVADRAAQYLAKMAAIPPPSGPMAAKHSPSEVDRHSFATALEVVQSPDSVLRHAAAGTLTPSRMAALKAVYPALARQVADVALTRMADNPKGVPYRSKLMLGILTGVDPDGTLATTARNQAVIRGNSTKPSNAGAPSSQAPKGADKLTLAQRTAPPGQSRETRKAEE